MRRRRHAIRMMLQAWLALPAVIAAAVLFAVASDASAQSDPLTLDDFDDTGLDVEFAAVIEAGDTAETNYRLIYQTSPRTPAVGSLLEGDLELGDNGTPIDRIRLETATRRLQLSESSDSFHIGNYFSTGVGSEMRLYLQNSRDSVSHATITLLVVHQNRAVLDLPTNAGDLLFGTQDGERLIIALAQPTAPAQVTGVTATADDHDSITVNWTAVDHADGYVVEWDDDSAFGSSTTATVSGGSTTTYQIAGLTAETQYSVRVYATRTDADDGPVSDTVTATTPRRDLVTGVSATADDHDSITVEWDAVTDAAGYVVEWDDDSAFGSSDTATIASGSTTTYQITGLAERTQYYLRVYATRTNASDSEFSDTVTATTTRQPAAQVTGVRVTATGLNSVTVAWDEAARAQTYRVSIGDDPVLANATRAIVVLASSTSLQIAGLTEGTQYYVWVVARRAGADDAPPSEPVTATPGLQAPTQVTGVSVSATDVNSITVEWDAVTDADGYVVEWDDDSAFGSSSTATISPGSTTTYQITGLSENTQYYVRAYATRTGTTDGPASDTATSTTLLPDPFRVTGVGASADDHDSITVEWDAVTDADGYVVEWDDDAAFGSSTTATISSGSTTTYQITGLSENTQYFIRVYATRTNAAAGAVSASTNATTLLQPPAQVTGVSAAANAHNSVTVNWSAAARATGYVVEWDDDSAFGSSDTATVSSGSTTTYRIASLAEGTQYYVRVYATRTGGADGAVSDSDSATTPLQAPAQVSGVSATAADHESITVNWTAAARATGYVVEWDDDAAFGSSSTATVSSGATTTHRITALTEGTRYYVRVYATRTGAADGAVSASTNATTLLQPPAQVTGVSAAANAHNSVTVNWSAAARATGYVVEWDDDSAFGSSDTATVSSGSTTTYRITSLAEGTQYYVRVYATRTGGADGAVSDSDSATTPLQAPAQVSGVSATAADHESITVNWTAAARATGYVVEWDDDAAFGSSSTATISSGSTTTYQITALTEGTRYYVRVYATRTGAADGAVSASDSATTLLQTPATVTGVSATADAYDSVTVNWSAAARAAGYVVEWDDDSAFGSSDTATVSGGSTTTYQITGLTENTQYHVRVYATRTGAADGAVSASDSATTILQAPAPVSGVGAAAADHESVTVNWTAAARATGYVVEWDDDAAFGSSSTATVSLGATTTYRITGLTEGTQYYVRVYATRTGADDGAVSALASATTTLQPPAQVTGLNVASTSATSIALTWDAAARADGYLVEWSTTSGTYTDDDTTTSASYTITSLSASTTYYVRVVSTRSGTPDGAPSDETSATTGAPPPPARVTGVSATAEDYDSIAVDWDGVSGATGYVVEWDDDAGFGNPSTATISSGSTTSYDITALDEDTTYYVRVKATRAGSSDGSWSSSASDRTGLQSPAQVTGLTATALSDTEIELRWNLSQRAGSYLAQWREDGDQYDTTRRATTAALRFTVSGLNQDILYRFRITATRAGADDAPPSNEASARTQPAPVPAQVTGVTATAISGHEVRVTWNAATNAVSYVVQWDADPAFPAPEQATAPGTGVIIEDLDSETEYFVRVYGVRPGAPDGPISATDSATTEQAAIRTWAERFPGGPVTAQLILAVFGGVMAGVRFKGDKTPQRESKILIAMCVAALILPGIGMGNIFWAGGIPLLIGLAAVAVHFVASRR